jgi:two-component system sensor histidine kinase KdpD
MMNALTVQDGGVVSARGGWVTVALLLVAATLVSLLLDQHVALMSQAMIYVLAVVIASYKLGWAESSACAVGAVTALNFFFVPPRWTLVVENRELFIGLATMLVVALVTSHLATGIRRESEMARLSERRARQLQALSTELANAASLAEVLSLGQKALDAAFSGPCTLVLANDAQELLDAAALPAPVLDGLRCCMTEAAVLGPGTGRWPGLNAWYLPLGDKGRMVGAACVRPAPASDMDGREHAQALCALLVQALWRLRLSASVLAAQSEMQRHQLQSTFLAAVSHDLRTPLAAIMGAASSLQTQRDRLAQPDQDRLLGSIINEASYLSNVTENTLQFVRLSNSAQELRRDWESIEEVVGAVLARVRQHDPQRRIKSKVASGLPLIKADPVLLAQMLGNLLDNALKHSDGAVDLTVSADNRALIVAVKDRGPGVSEAEQESIFEPYARGEQSGHRGAGLGLAVCRAIAAAHGGRLTFRRRAGGGSCFSASLPIEAQQPEKDLP